MRVVAVVCTYWPNRRDSVRKILQDLRTSTRPPDATYLLNNNPEQEWEAFPGVTVVNPGFNTTCRGKFLTALFDVADRYLLLDDDTSVGSQTIEALVQRYPTVECTGYLGCWVDYTEPPSVKTGGRLWPYDATGVTRCETFCGCAMWMSFKALCRMVALEGEIRTAEKWRDEGDDLLAGLANESVVVPLRGEECFVDLGYQGQAMYWSVPDYEGMRDRLLRDVLKLQGKWVP